MLHAIIAFTEGELSILKIKIMTSNQDFSKDKSCQWKDQILFFKQQITEGLYFMCCMQSLLLQKVSYQF